MTLLVLSIIGVVLYALLRGKRSVTLPVEKHDVIMHNGVVIGHSETCRECKRIGRK